MSIDIINDAFNYYDGNNELYRSIKKKIKYAKVLQNDKNSNEIDCIRYTFYDENRQELFSSRIEILSKYYSQINTWIWGWSLSTVEKSATKIIRKVFQYGTDIDIRNDNISNILLKSELLTSRFKITDQVQIDMHCAIASYLAKKPFILLCKDLFLEPNKLGEIFIDEYNGVSNIDYYLFILDPPNL